MGQNQRPQHSGRLPLGGPGWASDYRHRLNPGSVGLNQPNHPRRHPGRPVYQQQRPLYADRWNVCRVPCPRDGLRLDRLLLTTDTLPSGAGPLETSRTTIDTSLT